MSIINTIKTGLLRGNSYNFPEAGPFSVNALKASKFVDANATKENDDELAAILSGKKYSPEEIARRKDIFDIQSTLESSSFNTLDSLNNAVKNIKLLAEQYLKTQKPDGLKAVENEINALADEFNKNISSYAFKNLGTITSSLASKDELALQNPKLLEELNKRSNLLGANFINQAQGANTGYFKNLERNLTNVSTIELKVGFDNGNLSIDAGDLSGIEKGNPFKVIDQVIDRTNLALKSFLDGSALTKYLDNANEDFKKLDSVYDESSMLDLGQKFRAKIIADPKNGSAVHAFIDPYTAQLLTHFLREFRGWIIKTLSVNAVILIYLCQK